MIAFLITGKMSLRRKILNKVTRGILKLVFSLIGGGIGFALARVLSVILPSLVGSVSNAFFYVLYIALTLIFAIIFYLLYGSAERGLKNLVNSIDSDIRKLSAADFILGSIGLLVGLLISALIGILISRIEIPILSYMLTIFVYVIVIATSISIFVRRKDDFRSFFKSIKDKKNELKDVPEKGVKEGISNSYIKVVDTSVIIDGRIQDIMATGFIEGRVIIPNFVLVELQYIADSEDSDKRQRGRRGLDILNNLRKNYPNQVEVVEYNKGEKIPVDLLLLKMAEDINASVLTNDYNLNKVAGVKGIRVLNINDLANAVKPVVLPGEVMTVKITGEGTEEGQGVGYLNDGTMIVVMNGVKFIGKTVDVTVQSVLQTSAGRLIFAKVKNDK